jgi:hypothetical protein
MTAGHQHRKMSIMNALTTLSELGISSDMADECIAFFRDISGVVLSHEQLASIFDDDADLAEELVEWGVDDTEASAQLANALCAHLGAERWPTYGDRADLDAFIASLHAAATSRGYTVQATE